MLKSEATQLALIATQIAGGQHMEDIKSIHACNDKEKSPKKAREN